MLKTGYTSLEEILERLHRNYGFSIDKYNAAEWVWDVIGLLNIPYALEEKYSPELEITDWRVDIPVDCYNLQHVVDVATGRVLLKSSDVFHRYNVEKKHELDATSETIYFEGPTVVVDANNAIDEAETSVFLAHGLSTYNKQMTYEEYNGKLYFGYDSGKVVLHYTAFPVTDEGLPKIPDDPHYIRAVETYIAKTYALGLKIKGQIARDDLERLEQKYAFAAASVKGKALMPDDATMENIKNMQTRLIKIYNQRTSGFKYTNQFESLRKI